MLIIRRSNCINTSYGMISLCKWLLGMPVRRELQFPPDRRTKQSLTKTNHTRWCINTIRSPDDEHLMLETCREMKWINKYMKKCIMLVINRKLWRDARSTKYKILNYYNFYCPIQNFLWVWHRLYNRYKLYVSMTVSTPNTFAANR